MKVKNNIHELNTMKRTLLLSFALMLGLVAYQNASSATIPAMLTRILGAVWKFEKTEHNFGKIDQNVPVTAVFEFTNTGDAPLILTNVAPSCGCTAPTYTKEPIMPGKTGTIKAQYNAAAMGLFTKTITVTANTDKPIILTIAGEVVAATGTKQ